MPEKLFFTRIDSPVGQLLIVADEKGVLRNLEFDDKKERWKPALERHGDAELVEHPDPGGHASALRRYFGGDIAAIDEIVTKGAGTEFQRKVWASLRSIPAGTTTSYGMLAKTIGAPAAVRAVGLANGANPIAIVVPCHRVIGSDGSLTGYGGGLERKKWLLAHEARHAGVEVLGKRVANG